MEPTTLTALTALAGTLIGAAAGIAGTIASGYYSNRSERRRLAIETGFREWKELLEHSKHINSKQPLMPPALFVQFNDELMRLLDKGPLRPEGYLLILERRDALRAAILNDPLNQRKPGPTSAPQ